MWSKNLELFIRSIPNMLGVISISILGRNFNESHSYRCSHDVWVMDLPYVFVSILPFTSSKDSFPKAEILSWQKNFSYADLGTLQLCLKELMVSLFSFFLFFSHFFSQIAWGLWSSYRWYQSECWNTWAYWAQNALADSVS